MDRKKLTTIFLIVFVDLFGFSLLIPLIPFYAKTYAASDTVIGLLLASYAAAQFVGAPILGRLSDKYGRRPVLLISIFGTVVSLVMLGFANSLWLLFLSRIIDGLTGGNISVAQAYITDITDDRNRSRGLGLIGAAFGLGFILGPAIGGILSAAGSNIEGTLAWEFALPAFVAATIATINWLAVYFFLPESLPIENRVNAVSKKRRRFSFEALQTTFKRPIVGPLLTTRFVYGLAFATFQTIFSLYAINRLALDAAQTAFVLTYAGILIALVQGLLVGRLTDRFDERLLLFWSIVGMSLSLLAWAFAPTVLVLLIVLIPLSISGGIFNTVINTILTKSVTPQEIGGTLGISASLESLSRVIAPIVGGLLLDYSGTMAPGLLGFVITALLAPFVWKRIVGQPLPKFDQPVVKQAATLG